MSMNIETAQGKSLQEIRQDAMRQGARTQRCRDIRIVMRTLNLSIDEALDAFAIPPKERQAVRNMVMNGRPKNNS